MPSLNVSTTGISNTYNSISPDFLILILIISIFLGGLITIFSSLERYKKTRAALKWFGKCVGYFGYGMLGWGIFGGLWFVSAMAADSARKINWGELCFWIIIAISFFFGTAFIGWCIKKGWQRLIERKHKYDNAGKKPHVPCFADLAPGKQKEKRK